MNLRLGVDFIEPISDGCLVDVFIIMHLKHIERSLNQRFSVDALPITRLAKHMNRDDTFSAGTINASEALNQSIKWCRVTVDGVKVNVQADFNHLGGNNGKCIVYDVYLATRANSRFSFQAIFHSKATMNKLYLFRRKILQQILSHILRPLNR